MLDTLVRHTRVLEIVGDVIRVQNRATGASLQARVIDSGSAQVVP